MRLLVTGSSGLIGKSLCVALKNNGHVVSELDYTQGQDVTDMQYFSLYSDLDAIVHLASISFVPESFKNPANFYRTNLLGTLNALETARKTGAKFIYFSSYLYGAPEYLPVDENHVLNPHNPYAESKRMGEELCRAYFRDFGTQSLIFRPFNIYGENQDERFLIPTIINQARSGKVELMDPVPKRDYIHTSDVINAVIKGLMLEDFGCEVINLGSGVSHSVSEVVKIVKEYSEQPFKVSYKDNVRPNEVPDCYADIRKAKKMLNWEPEISLKEGIIKLLKEKNET